MIMSQKAKVHSKIKNEYLDQKKERRLQLIFLDHDSSFQYDSC